jgi:hypothetical protein
MNINERIKAYLCTLYTLDPATTDLTTLVRRYLDGATGEMTARMQALIAAAIAG